MIAAGEKFGAAVPVTKVKDTIIRCDFTEADKPKPHGTESHNTIADEPDASPGPYTPIDRNTLRAVQTPQAFQYGLICNAYDAFTALEDKSWVTDDAMVVYHMLHMDIKLVEGDENNIKVTTAGDLKVIKEVL